ncbi:hypothetical protein M436DRAFT_61202 [Aureobasidium namibiae CBS 147.97]|uniref:Uncharacterized protein n=1 Tax=Aureobasidium namibiae CBS 147.97 TaxID=1043004 RepID=A0A074WRW9_9PEZI|nr:uncharacterized protein M436DRAFT_61202 [Aureobasidium namibiae CBS 147.97]KEQ75903.1 hypothetical protein M436DRAFT_61202 [Aureobasidium namibiae CBS 147.97]
MPAGKNDAHVRLYFNFEKTGQDSRMVFVKACAGKLTFRHGTDPESSVTVTVASGRGVVALSSGSTGRETRLVLLAMMLESCYVSSRTRSEALPEGYEHVKDFEDVKRKQQLDGLASSSLSDTSNP